MASTLFKNWLIVIPARLASERLPHKPLQKLAGKSLISRVFENLKPLISDGADILVACDSEQVKQECLQEEIPFTMTSINHKSGTDRCREASAHCSRLFILNVQGDEPFVSLEDLKNLMLRMEKANARMGTLIFKCSNLETFQNPNSPKVIVNSNQEAIYFSRAAVPYPRDNSPSIAQNSWSFWQHIGVYAFSQKGLKDFCELPKSNLEDTEKLEQLRAIEAGWTVITSEASHQGIGVDTPADLHRAEEFLLAKNAGRNL